ncbi:hypothetical protein AAII07_15080 [Microvirga sp. 0TCS3.31]
MPKQTRSEIEQHLADQMRFLSSSAEAFDEGHHAEATRLSQTLRVLFHDGVNPETGRITSPSLMRQMGWIDDLDLLDSGGEPHPGSLISSCTLVYSVLDHGATAYFPHFGGYARPDSMPPEVRALFTRHDGRDLLLGGAYRPFAIWWRMPVVKDALGQLHSRRDLVLERANKDGGAHVDPTVKGKYARLSRENSMRQYRGDEDNLVPMKNPVTPAIRQIAYEVAVSFNHRVNRYRVEELGLEPLPFRE